MHVLCAFSFFIILGVAVSQRLLPPRRYDELGLDDLSYIKGEDDDNYDNYNTTTAITTTTTPSTTTQTTMTWTTTTTNENNNTRTRTNLSKGLRRPSSKK